MSRLTEVPGRLYRGEVSIDFVGKRKMWYTFSAIILVLSIAGLLIRGLNFSVEFKGGADFLISKAPTSVTQVDVQDAATDAGYSDAIVQHVGSGSQATWQVQTTTLDEAQTTEVQATLADKLGVPLTNINVTSVGASWGGQITQKAVQALIVPHRDRHLPDDRVRVADGGVGVRRPDSYAGDHHRRLRVERHLSEPGHGDRLPYHPRLRAVRHRGGLRQGTGEYRRPARRIQDYLQPVG